MVFLTLLQLKFKPFHMTSMTNKQCMRIVLSLVLQAIFMARRVAIDVVVNVEGYD